jgi:tetratricopeptide (TPR) repeat protein
MSHGHDEGQSLPCGSPARAAPGDGAEEKRHPNFMDIARELQKALQLHQAGQLADAADIYKEIIKAHPEHADAWNLLSTIFLATGNLELAVSLAQQATVLAPDFFVPYVNLGNALQASGQLEEAVSAFQKAITLNSGNHEVFNNLASVLNALERHEDALETCTKAITLHSAFPEAHNNMGNALAALGKLDEAVTSYRKALKHRSDYSDAHYNLGAALAATGDVDTALEEYSKAVVLDPKKPEKHYNLGNLYQTMGRLAEAEISYTNAIQLQPDYLDAITNLGSAVQALGRLEDAEICFRRGLTIEPESADVHWNLSLVLLQKGEYEEGWREYEWRWKNPTFTTPRRDFEQPQWDGGDLDGKTILVHAEQEIGDTLEFVRYAPLVADRGGRVALECRPPLRRLLETVAGVDRVVERGEALPDFDCHVPLMSLPRIFETRLDSIPDRVPYLSVPEGVVADVRLAEDKAVKVGIVWAGSPTRQADSLRSCDLGSFQALFDFPGIKFYSLQVGGRAGELKQLDGGEAVVNLGSAFTDFADTAAAVDALDLIVSVDTAVAHLAGALAKPVWVALSFAGGYLWMQEREDSPWYPSLRLFRQPEWGDWASVFQRIRHELEGLASTETPASPANP